MISVENSLFLLSSGGMKNTIKKKLNQSTGFWLFKTEPSEFSLMDLKNNPNQTTCWNGVRNYQARNYLRDVVLLNDHVFIYHSSCQIPAIVGIAKIVRTGYPDHTAWDPAHAYYDPQSHASHPIWYMVDVLLVCEFNQPITLSKIKATPNLKNMRLVQKGSRLSIQPVTSKEWSEILGIEKNCKNF